jgi:hypothetical protein
MELQIPFDVTEAMLEAMNKALYSGRTTHEVLSAGIVAAQRMGWVLQYDPARIKEVADVPVEPEPAPGTRHVLISLDDLMKHLIPEKSRSGPRR